MGYNPIESLENTVNNHGYTQLSLLNNQYFHGFFFQESLWPKDLLKSNLSLAFREADPL